MENRLIEAERRLTAIETDLKAIRQSAHASKNTQMKMQQSIKVLEDRFTEASGAVVAAKQAVEDSKAAVAAVQADTSEILAVLKTTKGIWGFGKKWGRAIIIAAIGAGFFNPKVTQFLTALFS